MNLWRLVLWSWVLGEGNWWGKGIGVASQLFTFGWNIGRPVFGSDPSKMNRTVKC
jgi:hypothetical protein